MARLLFWIAVTADGVWFWREFQRPAAKQQYSGEPDAALMVRCRHYGTHLPQDRALSSYQARYWTHTHLEQGPKSTQR